MSKKKKYKNGQFSQPQDWQLNRLREVYLHAQQLQQQGYLNEAERFYREILKQIPDQPDAMHYLGLIYMNKGDDKQAEKYIRQSIRSSGNPVYFSNYGLLLSRRGRHAQAIEQYKKSVELQPVYPEAWYNLGFSYSELGNLTFAEDAYKKAVDCRKDYIKALYGLASVQETLGKLDEARNTIDKLVTINPDSYEAYYTLGMALQFLGGNENIHNTEQYFRKALELSPNSLEIYIALANLYEDGNNIDSALVLYRQVLAIEPDYHDVKIKYANCLVKNDQITEAELEITKILKQNPDNISAQAIMGSIHRIKGDFVKADEISKKILEVDENNGEALISMAYSKKIMSMKDPLIDKLHKIANRKNISLSLYALGKIYNDLGEFDLAFDAYKKANEIKSRKIEYNSKKHSAFIDRVINVFTQDLIRKLQHYGSRSELPVFIVGTPRSGTTLTEQIISSHSKVNGGGELNYVRHLARNGTEAEMASHGYPERILTLLPDDIKNESNYYLEKISVFHRREGTIRITDKMPSNFFYLGYISVLFPHARVIHCKRNPLDTCLSMYFQAFQTGHQYSFDLNNLGHWYKDYIRLMEYWSSILGERILDIEYDDTVNETEKTARKMIEFCGLEWDEKCLEFYNNRRDIRTASMWQARQPIYKTSLERWKRYDQHIGVLKEILEGYY